MPKPSPDSSETSRQTIIVVGNGMVSHRFCQGYARSEALRARYALIVIGDEPHPAYDRTRLSAGAMTGAPPVLLAGADWYAQAGIDLQLGKAVTRIDREARTLSLSDGSTHLYDRLVLATGAQAFVPPIEGADSDGVFVYRTHADVESICAAAAGRKRGVVVGGGLLGLESARVLAAMGLEVHVVENATSLMSRQLDADSGGWLGERVKAKGLHTHLGYRLQRIERMADTPADASALRLHFDDGEGLVADVVVLATGIRPRDELAADAGLRVGTRGGVIVDDRLQTSDPYIFALGECAVHRGTHYGLVLPGYQMADALLSNLAGEAVRFERGDTSCELKLLDIPVATVGLSDHEGRRESHATEHARRTLVLDGRRLIGATAVGDWAQLARVRDAAKREIRLSQRQVRRFLDTGDLWDDSADEGVAAWPARTVVCNCTGVTRGQLSACVGEGIVAVEALTHRTGAGSVCGNCTPLLGQLVGTQAQARTPGRRPVLWASLATLLAAPLLMALSPVPEAQSVQDVLHRMTLCLRDPVTKQLTGFTLVGLSVLGMLMSARKRLSWFTLGAFGFYRALHTILSLLALLLTAAHTGMRMGHNVNFALMASFLAVAFVGAVAGVSSSMEAGGTGAWALRARRLRPVLSLAHILLLWPIPLLLGLHIFSVYYF